jgi:hypothetical protein
LSNPVAIRHKWQEAFKMWQQGVLTEIEKPNILLFCNCGDSKGYLTTKVGIATGTF